MADVLAEAVVELAADADKFGSDYQKALKGLEKDADKAAKQVDKAFSQLSGDLGKEFENATREIEREFKRQERLAEAHARRLEIVAARNAAALEREAIRAQNEIEKETIRSAREAEREVIRAQREIEKETKRVARENEKAQEQYKKEFIAAQQAMEKASRDTSERHAANVKKGFDSIRKFASERFSLSLGIDTSQILGAIGAVTKLGGLLGVLGTGALIGQASLAGVAQLVLAVQQLVGAIALLPAAGASAAIVVNTLKLGLKGLGDAINAESPKELEESFKKLSENGKKFVTVIRDFKDEFEELGKSVQQKLLEGFNVEAERLAKAILPRLVNGFGDVAKQLNLSGRALAGFAREKQTLNDLDTVFFNTAKSVQMFRGALRPAAEALRDVIAVGSNFLPQIALDFGEVVAKVSLLIKQARESGALAEFFENAIKAVKDFLATLANIGRIFGGISDAAEAALGGGFLSVLRSATQSVSNFVNSARGQMALIQFFEAAQEAAKVILPILGDLARLVLEVVLPALLKLGTVAAPGLNALVEGLSSGLQKAIPGIVSFVDSLAGVVETLVDAGVLDALGELVRVLGTSLGSAILSVAPKLGELVRTVLTKLAEIIPKILPGLVKFAVALGDLVIAALPVVDVLAEIISTVGLPTLAKLAETLTPIIGDLAKALGEVLLPILPDLAAAFGEWITAAGPLVDDILIALISLLRILLPFLPALVRGSTEIIKGLTQLTDVFAKIIEPISKFIEKMMAIPGVAKFFKEDLPIIIALITGGLVVALGKFIELLTALFIKLDEAGVFDVIIAGFAGFGIALHGAIIVTEWLGDTVERVFSFIGRTVGDGLRLMGETITNAFEFIKNIFVTAWEVVKAIFIGAWEFLKAIVMGGIKVILAILTGNFGAIPGIIREAFQKAQDAAGQAIDRIIEVVRGIPGKITGALGNLGNLLFSAGQDVVNGMVSGIRSAAGAIGRAAGDAARSALQAAKDAIIAKSPSRAMMVVGQDFGKGFVIGIDDMVKKVNQAGAAIATGALQSTTNALAAPAGGLATLQMNETLNRLTRNGFGPAPLPPVLSAPSEAEKPVVVAPEIHVYVGDEELTNFVTDVVDERDRRTKRSLNMGARRIV